MKKEIAKVFTSNNGEGIELEFDSDSSALIFWYFISRLDKNDIESRICELVIPEKE